MRRKKKIEEEENEEFVEVWNKKRLFIGSVIILTILALTAHYAVGSIKGKFSLFPQKKVLGTKAASDIKLPSHEDIDKILAKAKEDLAHLTAENVTSSQAAIGKIIYDLQQLQGGKKDAKSALCEMVCK